ncbi:hypothetical protein AAG906_008013 [Vitis piasezkii]
MDLIRAGAKRCLDLNEMEELRNDAYINSKVAKQRMKRWHDQLISNKEFHKGQRVLLYDSRLHVFPGKLKLRWIGHFIIHQVHLNGRNVKKVKEGSWESRGAQKARRKHGLRNFVAKVSRCENGFPLRNGFAAAHPPLRKFSLRRDPMAHECHFAAKYTHFTAAKWLRAFHALRSSVSQPKRHFEGCFAATKPPFGTRVPFFSPVHSFHNCEMVVKSSTPYHELKCCSRTPVGHILKYFLKFIS